MRRILTPVLVTAIVAVALGGATAIATHDPANKPSASGARADVAFLAPTQDVIVLREHLKTSAPTDLIMQLTSECSISTRLATTGNATSTAVGQIRYYVTIDGTRRIPVSQTDAEQGEVVFCDRAHTQTTTGFTNQERIEQHLRTRTANSFNWLALNVGSGEHTVEVHAVFRREDNEGAVPAGDNTSTGAVGARSLIIEPVKASNDEVVTETSERG
jgi:hypothetical protein